MADPPPVEAAAHPLSAGESLQPLTPVSPDPAFAGDPQPAGESPQRPFPELADSIPPGDSSGHPLPSVDLARPPLAELNPNEDLHSVMMAPSKKAPLNRPPSPRSLMVAPLRTLKKKKSVTKSLPYQHVSHEEIIHCKLKEFVPRVGVAAAAQPLQVIEAMDMPCEESEEDEYSEDEDEFDIEAFQIDAEKKAELVALMEKYDVYDEEQLRLALRREKKQRKNLELTAVAPPLSSESAPASPTGKTSRFIPPSLADLQPRFEDPMSENYSHIDGKSGSPLPLNLTFHNDQPISYISMHEGPRHIHVHEAPRPIHMQSPPHTIPMQSLPRTMPMQTQHVTLNNVDKSLPNTHNPHATTRSHHRLKPVDSQDDPHASNIDLGMHNPYTHPTKDHSPNPPPKPKAQSGLSLARPNSPSTSNNEPISCAQPDLTDFPPLPKGSTAHGKGGNGDTIMVSVDEGDAQPNGDPRHIISSPLSSKPPARLWLLLSGPPPLLRSGSKIPPLSWPLSPLTPPSTLQLEPRGTAKVRLLFRFRKLTRNVLQVASGSLWLGSFRTPFPHPTTSTRLSTTYRSKVLLCGIS